MGDADADAIVGSNPFSFGGWDRAYDALVCHATEEEINWFGQEALRTKSKPIYLQAKLLKTRWQEWKASKKEEADSLFDQMVRTCFVHVFHSKFNFSIVCPHS
jgi:hypothetical protein